MEAWIDTAVRYGLDTVGLALAVNLCTALCKMPIKVLARRMKNGANVTRLIVFLPIVSGFVLTVCYNRWFAHVGAFGGDFVRLWLSSSSLSLTFYAVFEKLIPVKNEDAAREIAESKAVIDAVKDRLTEQPEQTTETEQTENTIKLVLRGKKHETEE